jgi:hypothetical protein
MQGAVVAGRLLLGILLKVVGHDNSSHAVLADCDPDGALDEVADLWPSACCTNLLATSLNMATRSSSCW